MASARSGVLCAGTVVVDLSKVIDHYPPLDHIAIIEEFSIGTGGPGIAAEHIKNVTQNQRREQKHKADAADYKKNS